MKIKAQFSLTDAKVSQSEKQNNEEKKEEKQEENKPVDFDGVKNAIHVYADVKLKQGSRQLHTTLTTSNISFENNNITLLINNETQREQLQNIKQEFLDDIRKQLSNNLVTLSIEISSLEVQSKAYKPSDIFKTMVEKNPALLELKKRFDLEIDY